MVLLDLYCLFGTLLCEGQHGAFIKGENTQWVGPLCQTVFDPNLWDAPGTTYHGGARHDKRGQ